MSDIDATADISAAVESAPVDSGLDSSYETVETSTPSDTAYDTPSDDISESAVPVESIFDIDGTGISLDEARNGFLRQSDYTKKTQELAEQRSRLAEAEAITEALRNDPQGTLNALSEAFGVNFVAQDQNPYEDMDPDLARIAMLEQKIEAQEANARQVAIDTELNSMHNAFGEFNDQELFAHAIKGNFPSLQSAYADMNFSALSARLDVLTKKQAEEDARVQAKRDASVVHDGGNRVSGATVNSAPEQYNGIRDAFLAAKKALGVS